MLSTTYPKTEERLPVEKLHPFSRVQSKENNIIMVSCVSGGGGCVGVSYTIGFDGCGGSRFVGGCEF